MQGVLEDMFGEPVQVGDTLIVPRPAAAGTGYNLEYVRLVKINPQSITVQPIERDGQPKRGSKWNKNADTVHNPISIRISERYGDQVRLVKFAV